MVEIGRRQRRGGRAHADAEAAQIVAATNGGISSLTRSGDAGQGPAAKGAEERVEDGVAHGAERAEAHFALGGVDVDVDLLGRQVEEEEHDGLAALRQVRVGLADGGLDDRRGGGAAVHEDVLPGGVAARVGGQPGEAVDADGAGGAVERDEGVERGTAEEVEQAAAQVGGGREPVERIAVARERERHARMRDRVDEEHVADVRELGLVGSQERAARGDVVEQVAHLDHRAGRGAAVAHVAQDAAVDADLGAGVVCGAARPQREAGDRRDGREGFAAESERGDVLDVLDGPDLARGLALGREERVVAPHAAAVVRDGDELAPAGGHRDVDAARPGVERVLEQLLLDGRGPLHDLARGDLVRHVLGEDADRRAGRAGRKAGGVGRHGGSPDGRSGPGRGEY